MPKRKKYQNANAVNSREAHFTIASPSIPPDSQRNELVPIKLIPETASSELKLLELANTCQTHNRLCLCEEKNESTFLNTAELLCAYNVLPNSVNRIVFGLPDDIAKIASIATSSNIPISYLISPRSRIKADTPPLLPGTMAIADDKLSSSTNPKFVYTHRVHPIVAKYVAMRAIAARTLNICNVGLGVPAGSQWTIALDQLSQSNTLDYVLQNISSGLLSLPPSITDVKLADWRKQILHAHHLYSYQTSIRQNEQNSTMREICCFAYLPWYLLDASQDAHDDPFLSVSDEDAELRHDFTDIWNKLSGIQSFLNRYASSLNWGDSEDLSISIELGENFRDNCVNALDGVGGISLVEAYLLGVPMDDIIA